MSISLKDIQDLGPSYALLSSEGKTYYDEMVVFPVDENSEFYKPNALALAKINDYHVAILTNNGEISFYRTDGQDSGEF